MQRHGYENMLALVIAYTAEYTAAAATTSPCEGVFVYVCFAVTARI